MAMNKTSKYLGNAKTAGLPEDLHLTTTEYDISLSIFYIGYDL